MPLKHSVHQINLGTGAKGLIVDVPDSTVVSYTINFRAGNDYVKKPEIHQTAHLMEHMAFGPNEQFDTMEAFSQEFSRNGAYSNASTFDTNMHYYADCAQFEWERILRLQQLAITQPKFLPEILDAERGNVREELTGQAHNNPRVMWQSINRAMGGRSFSDIEKIATIDAVAIDDIIEHHQRTHTHQNMRFVLAGDLQKEAQNITSLLESWKLPSGERFQPISSKRHAASPISIKKTDQENSNFGLVLAINRNLEIPELVAFSALNHILTGTLHSRIWGKARATGICYGLGSGATTDLGGSSSWEFYGQVRPDNSVALFELMQRELQRIIDGDISDSELNDAKQFLTGDYQMRGQTVAALGGWYSNNFFFDETIDNIDDAAGHIAAVSRDNIVDLVHEFVGEKIWTLGEIGAVKNSDTQNHHQIISQLFDQTV